MNNSLFKTSCSVGLIALSMFILISVLLSYTHTGINKDAYYYLEISKLILQGHTLFVDFPSDYTPLSFYLMCIPFLLFGLTYNVSLIVIYLLHAVDAWLIYKICAKYIENKQLAVFLALLSFMLCWISGGNQYILEPFVLFFGLCSLIMVKNDGMITLFLSGFLSFCAFWCKQYGLGFIVLDVVYLFMLIKFHKSLIKKEFYLIVGFLTGLLVSLLIMVIQGVEISSLSVLSGSDYRIDGMSGLVDAWLNTIVIVPLLLVVFVMAIFKIKGILKNPLYILGACGLFGFMLQCYVRFYSHYMILARPFIVILLLAGLFLIKKEAYKKIYIGLIVFSSVIPMYFMLKANLSLGQDHTRLDQVKLSNEVARVIPHGSRNVYSSSDLLPILLLNENGSPYLSKYGPTNGFVVEADQTYDLISHASYCLISDEDYNTQKKYSNEVKDYLLAKFHRKDLKFKEAGGKLKTYYVFVRDNHDYVQFR